jgi:hypothetical protein
MTDSPHFRRPIYRQYGELINLHSFVKKPEWLKHGLTSLKALRLWFLSKTIIPFGRILGDKFFGQVWVSLID